MGIFNSKPNIAKMLDRKDVKALRKALAHNDPEVQREAMRAIQFLAQMQKKQDDVQLAIIEVIREWNQERYIDNLKTILERTHNIEIMKAATDTLGRIDNTGAAEALAEALSGRLFEAERNRSISQYAVEALGARRDGPSLSRLSEILMTEKARLLTRLYAVRALNIGWTGDERVGKAYAQIANDEKSDWELRWALAKNLAKMGDRRSLPVIIDNAFSKKITAHSPDDIHALLPEGSKQMMGDYGELIAQVVHGVTEKKEETLTDDYEHRSVSYNYDTAASDEAVKQLCELQTRISSNILRQVSKRPDHEITPTLQKHDDGFTNPTTYLILFEKQRATAKKELKKRNNPPYDPSLYIDATAWQL